MPRYNKFPVKDVKVTLRFTKPYKTVMRNVNFKNGYGTYIIFDKIN